MNIIRQLYTGNYTPGAFIQSFLDKHSFLPILQETHDAFFAKENKNHDINHYCPFQTTPLSQAVRSEINGVFFSSVIAITGLHQFDQDILLVSVVSLLALTNLSYIISTTQQNLRNYEYIELEIDTIVTQKKGHINQKLAKVKEEKRAIKPTNKCTYKLPRVLLHPRKIHVQPIGKR